MAFFRFRWFHKFVRRNTNPIPVDKAELWKRRLSFAYMICAWNAFGIIAYYSLRHKEDWGAYHGLKGEAEIAKKPAIYYAELLGIQKAKVVDVKGFKKVDEYEYSNPNPELDEGDYNKNVESQELNSLT